MIYNVVKNYGGIFVFIGVGECVCEGYEFYYEMKDFGVLDKIVLVFG